MMEFEKQLEASISQALREVERDLFLPSNSLVDETPLPKIREGVKRKTMEVQLDGNFMARVPDNLIRHSKELKLRKRVVEQEKTISRLGKTLDVLLEQ